MKILIIKNKFDYSIDDGIEKFKDWLARKTPLTYEFEEKTTDLDVKLTPNLNNTIGNFKNIGGIGYIEAVRFFPKIFERNKYDCVFFLYKADDAPFQVAGRAFPFLINGSICVELPVTKYWHAIGFVYRGMTHEMIHCFHHLLHQKGIDTPDTLDIYDGEEDVENGNNRIRNLAIIAPHWAKLGAPKPPSTLDNILSSIGLVEPKYKYFKANEIAGLKPELVKKLDEAREKAGIPFVITSGKRTIITNEEVGGVENSSHLTGEAVDLRCQTSVDRWKMLNALLAVKFNRIGIYKNHLHCDISKDKPQEVIWYS